MTDLFSILLFPAVIVVAVLIWIAIKRNFRISQKSLTISRKAEYTIIACLILLAKPEVRQWIERQFGTEEELTDKQKDIKTCDAEGRAAAAFSFWDSESTLNEKDSIYIKTFLDCTTKQGHSLTDKQARIIESAHDPFWKRNTDEPVSPAKLEAMKKLYSK